MKILLSCDYTNNTIFKFDKELCDCCDDTNFTGSCCANNKKLACANISDKWVQLFIPEIRDIPTQKPDVEGIISVTTAIEIISQRVIKTPTVTGYTDANGNVIPGNQIPNSECTFLTGKKLIIEGFIRQKVVYTALVEDQAMHSATFAIPFSTFIIIDGDTPLSQSYKVYPFVEDAFVCKLSERSIFTNSTLFLKASPVC